MELDYKIIKDSESFEAFRSLLNASGLSVDDLDFEKDLLVGYYEGDELVGTGGLEIYGPYALLRSLSVKMGIRGKAVGSTITEYLLAEAKTRNLKNRYKSKTHKEDIILINIQKWCLSTYPEIVSHVSLQNR